MCMQKRKRARSQRSYQSKRYTPRRKSRRACTTRRRKRGRPRLSARRQQRAQESSSSSAEAEGEDNPSSSSYKRPCRSVPPKEKKNSDDDEEKYGDDGEASRSNLRSNPSSNSRTRGRDQESRPGTSKHKSLDTSQMYHAVVVEKWDITMAQAPVHEPLDALQGCGSLSPRSRCSSGGAREMSQEKPQSKSQQGLL